MNSVLLYTLYALFSAACYVAATVVMKYFDTLGSWKAWVLIVATLVGAVLFETAALRAERFGLILLLILGCECAIGLMLSWLWFEESYRLTEIVGFTLIIAGIGLVKV